MNDAKTTTRCEALPWNATNAQRLLDWHPGDAEANAAIAAMNEQTVSGPYRPGMRVTCPRAFADGRHEGVIVARETDRHVGTIYRIDTPQGRQTYLPEELEVVS